VSGAALTLTLVAKTPGLAQLQIVQTAGDAVRFRVVRGHDWSEASEKALLEMACRHFGEGMRYSLEYVGAIPTEASGKYRLSISEVSPTEFR
jgi:hypothetical protein